VVVQDSDEYATVHLVQWVWEFYSRGRIVDAADPRLNSEFDGGEIERVLVTALWCAHHDRTMRPSIRQAVNVLRLEAPLPNPPNEHASGDIHASGSSLTWPTRGCDQQQQCHHRFERRDDIHRVFLAKMTKVWLLANPLNSPKWLKKEGLALAQF
jgi:hypothetical protein